MEITRKWAVDDGASVASLLRPKSESRSVFSGARRVRGPAPGGWAWVRSREVFRDAVCARVVSRVMRWVGKLREQAEKESQDGAWTALGGVAIARPNRTRRRSLPIPMGALGRLTPGGPKLPPTGRRVARAGPRGPCPRRSRRLSRIHWYTRGLPNPRSIPRRPVRFCEWRPSLASAPLWLTAGNLSEDAGIFDVVLYFGVQILPVVVTIFAVVVRVTLAALRHARATLAARETPQ